LVEAKNHVENDTRCQRLDLLIHDGTDLPKYGFEFVISASKTNFKNHINTDQNKEK
jgi:hypothetical protein